MNTTSPPPITEKEFMHQVLDLGRVFGWLIYHTHNSRRSTPGFPDLVAVRRGEVLFIELKAETGKLTGTQERWLDALRDTQATVYVWRPGMLQEIADILR